MYHPPRSSVIAENFFCISLEYETLQTEFHNEILFTSNVNSAHSKAKALEKAGDIIPCLD